MTSDSGDLLRARRKAAGLSRGKLANLAGVSPGYIGLLEEGYAPEKSEALGKLDRALTEAEATS